MPGITLAVGLTVALTACSGGGEQTSTPSSVVVQPGRPGEPATTVSPEDFVDDGTRDTEWNQADVDYVTMMIDHHVQALEMSALAPERAVDDRVRSLASRIYDTQGAEIHGLAAWLQERELPVPVDVEQLDGSGPRVPDGAAHDHGGTAMPGMLTDEQLAALETAAGAEFDRLYLERMIQHHEGAVEMSTTVIREGVDQRANELATDIGAGQEAEIGRLKEILASL